MAIDTKHDELKSLRIDRSVNQNNGDGAPWARRYIVMGIAVVVVLGLVAVAYRLLAGSTPEVEVVRATAEGANIGGGVVLTRPAT